MQDNPTTSTVSAGDPEDPLERSSKKPFALSGLFSRLSGKAAKANGKVSDDKNGDAVKDNGAIGRGEEEMIANIIKAGTLSVDDVMVPRADMICLSADLDNEATVQAINQAPHTRYAVYGEDMDDILGMVHIKDVLKALSQFTNGSAENFRLKDILRRVIFVAPSMRAMDLLLRMRLEGVHLAIVVDEHGGTDGQVPLEDLVEEVIGDIRDELDGGDEPTCEKMPDNSYIVDGRYDLEELQNHIGNFLEANQSTDTESATNQEIDLEDIDTVGGLVMALAGRMPLVGEVIRHDPSGWEFHISHADPRRISRVRMYHRKVKAENVSADV